MTNDTMTNTAGALAPAHSSLLFDSEKFEVAQRAANMMARSILFPDHLKKNRKGEFDDLVAIANGVLVMNMADRTGEDALLIAQNIYIVGGKPGFGATYMIAKANQSGVFRGRINWKEEGEGDALVVTAFATLAETGEKVHAEVSMKMAKAEGWTKNPKYQTMPKTMLRYRSATALIRFYAPEVMIGGLPAKEDLEDELRDVTPRDVFDQAEPEKVSRGAPRSRTPKPVADAPAPTSPTAKAADLSAVPEAEIVATGPTDAAEPEPGAEAEPETAAEPEVVEEREPDPDVAHGGGALTAETTPETAAEPDLFGGKPEGFNAIRDLSQRAYQAWCEFVADVGECSRATALPEIQAFHEKLLEHLKEKHPAGYDEAMTLLSQRRAEILAAQ